MQGTAFKRAFQLLLFIAFSAAVGRALVLNPGASVAGWVTNLAPAIMFGMILMIWVIGGLPLHLSDWMPAVRKPNSREMMVVGGVVLVMVPWAAFIVIQWPSVTYVLIFLLVTVGVLGACVLIASGRQAWGLVLWIITMPFVHFLEYHLFRHTFWYVSAQGIFFVTPTTIILWFVGLISMLKWSTTRRPFVWSPFGKVWLFMIVAMAISATFSVDRLTSFRSVTYLLTIAIPYFMVVNGIRTTGEVKLCTLALGLAGAVRVLSVLYHQVLQTPEGISGRFSYYGGHAIVNALVWGATLGAFMLFGSAFSMRSTVLKKLLFGLSAIVLLLAAPFLPRSSIIAVLSGVMAFLVLRRTRSWILLGLAATIVVFTLWWPILAEKTALGRFREFTSLESFQSSQRMRIDGARSAWLMIRDHPFVGIGPGMWDNYIPSYSQENFLVRDDLGVVRRIYVSGSHNIFLDAWATIGVGGLLSQIIFYLVILRQSIRLYRQQRHGPLAELAIAFVAFSIMMGVGSIISGGSLTIFEPTFFVEAHYTLWFLLGLLAAWRNLDRKGTLHSNELLNA